MKTCAHCITETFKLEKNLQIYILFFSNLHKDFFYSNFPWLPTCPWLII